jgi:hypothetical protein
MTMKINLDWHWSKFSTVWLLMILFVPLVQRLHINPDWVLFIEQGQTFFLLFCFVFTLISTLYSRLTGEERAFWLWASLWWLVLLGRDQNWGRQTFSGYSHAFYHGIAAVLILGLILMLLWPRLRAGIKYYYHKPFPAWNFLLAATGFLLADAVERGRWIAQFILYNPIYDDMLEELYECPFILALFTISAALQWRTIIGSDRKIIKAS